MQMKRYIGFALLMVLIVGYGFSNIRLTILRANRPLEEQRMQALSLDPTLLRVISGPFKGLMADYLLLKATVFMGGVWEVTDEDRETLYTLLKQSLHLDPLFFQTGYYVQGLLSWREGFHEKAVELLKYQAERREWDWEPMFYLGFNLFFYLNDTQQAITYLQAGADRPGAPLIMKTLAARLLHRSGQTLTAIGFLKTMMEQAEDEPTKAIYAKRLEAYMGVYELEQGVQSYHTNYGRYPSVLDELVKNGLLKTIPQNPFDEQYFYDSDTGRVFFDDVR